MPPPARPRWTEILCAWLCAGPLFVLTLRGWSNIVLLAGMLACIALLVGRKLPPVRADLSTRAVLLALLLPLGAVLFSSLLRADLYWATLDAPSRLWAAVPIFVAVLALGLPVAKWFSLTLPLALFVTLVHQWAWPQPRLWGEGRMSTYFADPLVFGYLCLAFGLMCLMGVRREGIRQSPARSALLLAGFACGMVLSVQSGSRSGWLAIPVVLAIWLHLNLPRRPGRGRALVPLGAMLVACVAAALAYAYVPKIHARVQEAASDLGQYSFTGIAPDSPVGLRVTFLRIAGDLIAMHPIAGVGDTAHAAPKVAGAFPYASEVARRTAFSSAFHNQVITNTVRYGVLGGLAALLLLAVPLVVYARQLSRGEGAAREAAAMGLAFGVVLAISSLTTEVVDLKYTASLYALMTALLCGASLARHGQD